MTPWELYRQQIDAAASRKSDDPFVDAEAIVQRMPAKVLPGILARLTQREIEKARDLYALTRPRPSKPQPDLTPTFQTLLEHPQKLYIRNGGISLNSKQRRKFERWCRDQGHDFDEWLDRLLSVTPSKALEVAKLDWIQGYRTPSMVERDRQFWKETMGYIDAFAQNIRLEVTAELLGESFTLPDGRKVTWADATLDDHEVQRNHLGRVLGDTAHQAALHQRAIELLCEHEAKNLGELEAAERQAS